MKKVLSLVLEDDELIDLLRILLESGWKVMIEVPGAGMTQISGNLFHS